VCVSCPRRFTPRLYLTTVAKTASSFKARDPDGASHRRALAVQRWCRFQAIDRSHGQTIWCGQWGQLDPTSDLSLIRTGESCPHVSRQVVAARKAAGQSSWTSRSFLRPTATDLLGLPRRPVGSLREFDP